MHRIIIVGGGAGGLELATRLGDYYRKGNRQQQAQVVLVDRNPTHIWKPLLHEVAAGSMDPFTHQLEYAAQARWHGFEFQQGGLQTLDRATRTIGLDALVDEDGMQVLPARRLVYDTLVLAIGSTTHFFGVKGAPEYAIALDTVGQAEQFRRRLIAACMRAQSQALAEMPGSPPVTQDGAARRPRVQIAIVGAGATGVELSAELRGTAEVLVAYGLNNLDPRRDVGIALVEAGPRILPALPERVSESTAHLLRKLNIELMVGETVAEVTADSLVTGSGKTIHADLTVWAAGIKAPAVLATLDGLATNRLGQLVVRPTLQTETDDNVFALGDCASAPWLGQDRAVPPRAQAAHQQASFLFKAFKGRIEGRPVSAAFKYRDFGSLVSLGHFSAVGNLMGGVIGGSMLIEGLFARFMYKSLYRLHVAALHGWARMVLDALAHALRRSAMPRVKLH